MSKPSIAAVLLIAVSSWGQTNLPAGTGKDLVEQNCLQCHEIQRVTNTGHTPAEWTTVVNMMINDGSPLPKDQVSVVADYLAKNFPPKPEPDAIIIPGDTKVSIQEWDVPTAGSRPHDPMAARDGSIWYTGQMANVLGRLDPETGQIKEFQLKTPHSGPHGLVEDKEGNIWFTANFEAYIGKLNPKTGEVKEYPMPDPNAHDPHTLIFDQKGIVWFTVQGADMVGRLDPKSGEVKLEMVPTPKALPYGMVVSSKGVPFFVEFGSNKIASIDPQTMKIHEYVLKHAESRPRRIAITSDDVLWYSDYSRGYLGRFDVKSGENTEWMSPGGPKSRPYGITALHDVIWYSESNVKPNTLVRFDPKGEKFQTWAIPSGGGVVRNMMPTPDGGLALACSGVNKVARVTIQAGREERAGK